MYTCESQIFSKIFYLLLANCIAAYIPVICILFSLNTPKRRLSTSRRSAVSCFVAYFRFLSLFFSHATLHLAGCSCITYLFALTMQAICTACSPRFLREVGAKAISLLQGHAVCGNLKIEQQYGVVSSRLTFTAPLASHDTFMLLLLSIAPLCMCGYHYRCRFCTNSCVYV